MNNTNNTTNTTILIEPKHKSEEGRFINENPWAFVALASVFIFAIVVMTVGWPWQR